MASACYSTANQIQVRPKPSNVSHRTTHRSIHSTDPFIVKMSAVLDRFRAPFSFSSFPKNGFIRNDEDLEELLPSYPQTLTRPLQIRATLPQDNFLLRSQEERQKKPKESKSKVSNFCGLKGRRSKNNAGQFTNSNNIWPESEDRFFEMKSSPLLQFFDR